MKITIKPDTVKRFISVDDALAVLKPYKEGKKMKIHTFSQVIFGVMGCSIDLSVVKKRLRSTGKRRVENIQISGRIMQSVSHGIAIWGIDGWLYLETDMDKLNQIIERKKL